MVESCTAGAGTLTIEFTLLSRLLGDPVYENVARRAVRALWERRHRTTGLVGQYIARRTSCACAGMSSFPCPLSQLLSVILKSWEWALGYEDIVLSTCTGVHVASLVPSPIPSFSMLRAEKLFFSM